MTDNIINEIKFARIRMKKNQDDMAQALGISKTRYCSIENHIEDIRRLPLFRFVDLCYELDEEFRDRVGNIDFLANTIGKSKEKDNSTDD